MSKPILRASMLEKRGAMSPAESETASAAMAAALKGYLEHQPVPQLLGFWPFRGEPDLTDLLSNRAQTQLVGLPSVLPAIGTMVFRQYDPSSALIRNRYGIWEPAAECPIIEIEPGALLLMPCVAADHHGVRLGYGGGYYDRFLAACPNVMKLGVVFHEFFVSSIPLASHDQLLNGVLTEKGLSWFDPCGQ